MTAGYIGSGGESFARDIITQRKNVDAAADNLRAFAESNMDELAQSELIEPVFSDLKKIGSMRASVDSLNASLSDALSYYTKINSYILGFNATVAKSTDNKLLKQKFTVLYNVSYTKEYSRIERALLSNAFGNGSFSPALYSRWLANQASQKVYLKTATDIATDEFYPFLKAFAASSANTAVQGFRDYAQANAQGQLERSAAKRASQSRAERAAHGQYRTRHREHCQSKRLILNSAGSVRTGSPQCEQCR